MSGCVSSSHELRNLVNTAIVAFEVLKTGSVGLAGTPGPCSIAASRDCEISSLARRSPFDKWREDHETNAGGRIHRRGRGRRHVGGKRPRRHHFDRAPAQEGLAIDADQHILAAVVGNLLQNAFTFTRPNSTVTLTVGASADRVLIEVQDECGGLPGAGDAKELFPSFEQRGADRTGLGIGLAFSRWDAEAIGGRLYARNLPDQGCVFIVDLPQSPVPAVALV